MPSIESRRVMKALTGVFALALLIQVGASGPVTASSSPIVLLGRPIDAAGCTTAPQARGSGTEIICDDYSAVAVDGTTRVVRLRASDTGAFSAYTGSLPLDLSWFEPMTMVTARLGEPQHITAIWGPPTLVYMDGGNPYGSLELLFNAGDALVGINASLTR